jgi:rubredoxin
MKCTNCNYKHGWDPESQTSIKGGKGDFYQLPIELTRESFYSDERVELFGCPSCGFVFIDK